MEQTLTLISINVETKLRPLPIHKRSKFSSQINFKSGRKSSILSGD